MASAKIFIVGMKMTATPNPTKIRANMATDTLAERPKGAAPGAAINVKRVTAFPEPRESGSMPAGNWMMTKGYKYAEAKPPRMAPLT